MLNTLLYLLLSATVLLGSAGHFAGPDSTSVVSADLGLSSFNSDLQHEIKPSEKVDDQAIVTEPPVTEHRLYDRPTPLPRYFTPLEFTSHYAIRGPPTAA